MNWAIFTSYWKQRLLKATAWWGHRSHDHLGEIAGMRIAVVGNIQGRDDISMNEAKQQVRQFSDHIKYGRPLCSFAAEQVAHRAAHSDVPPDFGTLSRSSFMTPLVASKSDRGECPWCRGALHRIPRRSVDRLLSQILSVRRYQCGSIICGWEGNLRFRPASPLLPDYTPL